jgi:hypothetical protein
MRKIFDFTKNKISGKRAEEEGSIFANAIELSAFSPRTMAFCGVSRSRELNLGQPSFPRHRGNSIVL